MFHITNWNINLQYETKYCDHAVVSQHGVFWLDMSISSKARSQVLFLKLSAQNRTRCVYLHGCVVMIKRFPPAGCWPISVLQKWCRENLAQSGSRATADWTSCTSHKWESLILHVGRVFPHAVQEPFFLWDKAVAWPDSTQSAPLLFLLLSLFLPQPRLCLLSLSYVWRQSSRLPLFVEPIW